MVGKLYLNEAFKKCLISTLDSNQVQEKVAQYFFLDYDGVVLEKFQ